MRAASADSEYASGAREKYSLICSTDRPVAASARTAYNATSTMPGPDRVERAEFARSATEVPDLLQPSGHHSCCEGGYAHHHHGAASLLLEGKEHRHRRDERQRDRVCRERRLLRAI